MTGEVPEEAPVERVGLDPRGLTSGEARRRLEERGPLPKETTSRSYLSIAWANTFTVFNLILVVFGAATLTFGDPKDALFLGILVANITIGVGQEIRAKRALDKLAALIAVTATVIRDGEELEIPLENVVVGDLVLARTGDQIVADGEIVTADGLQLDESNLTGESEPVSAAPGKKVWSGSFAVEGEGQFEATALGPDSRAAKLAATAKAFRHPRSPLEKAMDRLLIILVAVMVPLATGLGISLAVREVGQAQAVETLTAAVVNIVPEGLILLVSLTAAVSAAKMARRGVLAQQLNAIESLASVTTLCTDKTGTLTEASLRVVGVEPAVGQEQPAVATAFGRYAASMPSRNGTLEAIHEAGLGPDGPGEPVESQVPFSSRRRWGALEISGERMVVGAPEALLAAPDGIDSDRTLDLARRAHDEAARGRRVLAIARAGGPLPEPAPDAPLPAGLEALGFVVLAERLRDDAERTVEFFEAEEVALKILSGDAPATVGAIARDAGIAGSDSDAGDGGGAALSGENLPGDDAGLLAAIHEAPAVGRISPEDKERVVRVLGESGEYVGMIGDGVNDVPALKKARLAIAQGSGTQMARSVSDLVLVSGSFAEVAPMVHEGRQILRNIQRVSRLFVTKALFTAFLLIAIAIPTGIFPLLPRQFTLTSSLTIGIPAFLLALAPSSGPWRPDDYLKAIARFSLPAGIAMGIGILTAWVMARNVLDCSLAEARTVTAATIVAAGLLVVMVLEDEPGRRRLLVGGLCALMALGFVLSLYIPFVKEFFALESPTGAMAAAWACGAAVGSVLMFFALRLVAKLEERARQSDQADQDGSDVSV
ncbi:MAG: HAD-IC family P-type ATPase [Actinomycetota bacterium]|nr:HAD-IC family P-type ATPase [Actinomycetota bacterium]